MLIRPSLEVPAVLRRSLEAFRAGDPITIAEAFEKNARLSTQIDPKLARGLGMPGLKAPIEANGPIEIMKFFALEFNAFDITHLEVIHTMQVGREVAAVCDWGIKMRGTGHELVGRCHNIWTMDQSGRKVVDGRNVCKIITPGWDHGIN